MFKAIYHYVHHRIRRRWERHYFKSHWHLVLDLSLTIVVIFLAAIVIGLYFFRPNFSYFGVHRQVSIDLNNPPLVLSFSVEHQIITPKQGTILKINFKNNGAIPVKKLIINFSTLSDNFMLNKINLATSSLSGVSLIGSELSLNKISGHQSGEVDLQVYFKNKDYLSRNINWLAQSQYSFDKQVFKENQNLPVLKVAAKLNTQAGVYYTSPQGDQLGVGPLPPIVGIPTIYWVFLETKNLNNFDNFVFSAQLPLGVELGNRRSLLAGQFNYSSSTRRLIWKVARLEGKNNIYRLGFEVKIVPTIKDLDKVLTLVDNLQYYASDPFTGQEINGHLDRLTTDLKADRFDSGKGKVINQ